MITTIIQNTSKHFLKPLLSEIIIYLVTAFYLFLPAQPDNAQLTVREVSVGDTAITYDLVNDTRRVISKPHSVKLEKNTDGLWEELTDATIIIPEDYYTVYPGQKTADTVWIHGIPESDISPESDQPQPLSDGKTETFEEGEYRLTVYYNVKSLNSSVTGEASVIFSVQ